MIRFPVRLTLAVVGLVAMMIVTQVASAQPRGGRGFGRGFGVSSIRLATLDQVQTELSMTDEQKTKVADINDQLRSDRRELFDQASGDFGAIQADMEKLTAEAVAKVSEALDEAQRQRLAGITIQLDGPMALNDPLVVGQLNLGDEVKAKLGEVRAANSQAMRDAWSDAGDLSREERRAKFAELREAAGEKLLAVLSPAQQAEFDQLKGEPIEIDLSQLRGRRGN